MLSLELALQLILIGASLLQPLLRSAGQPDYNDQNQVQHRQLANIPFDDIFKLSTQILTGGIEGGSLFWDILVRTLSGAGSTAVIRDIIRVTLDRSSFYRAADGISALTGFTSLVTKELAEMSQEISTARGDTANLLAQILNGTSQTAGIGVGILGRAVDTYTVVRNSVCLVVGACGRYDFLDMVGSMGSLGAGFVAMFIPEIGPYIPVAQTYYTVITWALQTVDEAVKSLIPMVTGRVEK